jgi:thiamine biosynthesis lipoprotein
MIALSVAAMATRFELVLAGDDPVRLRASGEAALAEIERLERQLSFYRRDSDVAWINDRAADGPVRVDPRVFRLLERCAELTDATDGAFDVTVGPLVRAWGFAGGARGVPDPEVLAAARSMVGMGRVELDGDAFAVRFAAPGVEIDLGGYGKGYAVERAIEVLREDGVPSALLHGGTSSVYGLGAPPDAPAWRIALAEPLGGEVELRDAGLSVSAAHGKWFTSGGETYGHVLDPRRGEPVRGAAAAAVVGPSPATCEALSKALMVHGARWLATLRERFPEYVGVVPGSEATPE